MCFTFPRQKRGDPTAHSRRVKLDKRAATNNFTAVCRNVAKDNGLDAAILVTVKADRKKDTAAIELHGDGPNEQAVLKMKEIISTALTESIKQFKSEKAKQEATNAN